jgi:hypothetical protein
VADKAATTKVAKPAPKKNGKVHPAAQKAIEESTPIDDDPAVTLSAADLEVAKKVYVGDFPCELGATVHITPHKREGFFIIRTGLHRFRMHPVESRTGAIRLEDPVGGAMWLQLGNKSMLMSQKMGRRLADECMSPAQAAVAEALKLNPAPSLLEPLPTPKAGSAAPAAATAATTAPTPAVTPATTSPAAAAVTPATPPAAAPAATIGSGATAPSSTSISASPAAIGTAPSAVLSPEARPGIAGAETTAVPPTPATTTK